MEVGVREGEAREGEAPAEPRREVDPDFALIQIAERRGALDDRLKALIAEKKAEAQVVAKRNVQAHTDERTRESKRLNLKLSARRG